MIPTSSYFSLLESSSLSAGTQIQTYLNQAFKEKYKNICLHVKWQVHFFALLILIKHTEPGRKKSEFSPLLKCFDHNDHKC